MNICQTIETAFDGVGYPGDRNIIHCGCPVCRRIIDHFRGTTWRDHDLASLQKHQLAVSLFTPEAFQFFLPAYMIRSQGAWLDTCLIPFLLTKQFLPPAAGENAAKEAHYVRRSTAFSPAQRQAIVGYLREYAASGTALVAEDVTRAIAALEGPMPTLSPQAAAVPSRPH